MNCDGAANIYKSHPFFPWRMHLGTLRPMFNKFRLEGGLDSPFSLDEWDDCHSQVAPLEATGSSMAPALMPQMAPVPKMCRAPNGNVEIVRSQPIGWERGS